MLFKHGGSPPDSLAGPIHQIFTINTFSQCAGRSFIVFLLFCSPASSLMASWRARFLTIFIVGLQQVCLGPRRLQRHLVMTYSQLTFGFQVEVPHPLIHRHLIHRHLIHQHLMHRASSPKVLVIKHQARFP